MIDKPPASQSIDMLVEEVNRLRRAVDELSILNDLACAIGASIDADEIMQTIIRRSLRAVNADQGVITLVEDEHQPMRTLIRARDGSAAAPEYHLHQALLGWMHLHKKPLIVDSPLTDPRFRGVPWNSSIHTVLCVPLIVKSELRGVLTVYNKKDDRTFTADDRRLLAIIAAQSAQVIENARLSEEESAYRMMRQEVELAAKIQSDLLPRATVSVPGYEIAARTLPAQSVGGDYYDFIPADDGTLAVCLGDVSGKGLPASLLMANLQATLRGQTLVSRRPADCLHRSNTLLFRSTSPDKFATLFYGVIDPVHHMMRYTNAGHDWPFHITANGSYTRLTAGGIMLGLFENAHYEDEGISFLPGDILVIHSDGITEAMNAQREEFGEANLRDLLVNNRDRRVSDIIDLVVREVRAYAGANAQSDDITIMAVKRTA